MVEAQPHSCTLTHTHKHCILTSLELNYFKKLCFGNLKQDLALALNCIIIERHQNKSASLANKDSEGPDERMKISSV